MLLLRLGWLALGHVAALAAGPAIAGAPPAGEAPPAYTDMMSASAQRNLEKIGAKNPAGLSEAEGVEWVRARFAWVALLRLEGKEPEALRAFEGCGSYCGKWGPSAEWAALKKWGCARRREAPPCRKP